MAIATQRQHFWTSVDRRWIVTILPKDFETHEISQAHKVLEPLKKFKQLPQIATNVLKFKPNVAPFPEMLP